MTRAFADQEGLADLRLKQIELLAVGDVEPRRGGHRSRTRAADEWAAHADPASPALDRRTVHLLVQMLVQRCWTSRPVGGRVGLVMRIDGRAALTLPEAARWLGLTVPCIHALIERGELPFLREPDGSIRISAAALVEWAGKAGGGDPPPTPK